MVDSAKLSILRTIYTVLCTFCMIVHTYLITVDYLQYDTVTSVYIGFPTIVQSPALSVCFKYEDIIDRTWLVNTYGQSFNSTHGMSWYKMLNSMRMNITLTDIFERTPSATECCNNGMVRNETNYGVRYLKPRTILDHFQVS